MYINSDLQRAWNYVENISETAVDKLLLYFYAKINNAAINSCFKVDPLFLWLYLNHLSSNTYKTFKLELQNFLDSGSRKSYIND